MVVVQGSRTMTERVYEQVRAAVLTGRYKPGAPLRLAALAEELEVSPAIIREALVRLTERHLVTLTPNHGFSVVGMSRKDLADIDEVRLELQSFALRRSIDIGDMDWEARVVSTHHVLERTPFEDEHGVGPTEQWAEAHNAFHEALGSGCGNRRLLLTLRVLRDSAELYSQLGASVPASRQRDLAGEHRALMVHAMARDPERAEEALEVHFRGTNEIFSAYVFPEQPQQR